MTTVPPPARPDNSAALPPCPHPVTDARRHLHETQVCLAFGDPVSLRCDEAAAAYDERVAESTAERFAKIQELVASLRLLAEDETGLREYAGRYISTITGQMPAKTVEVLRDVIGAVIDNRQQVAVLGIDLVAVDSRVGTRLNRIETAFAAHGIEVRT